MGKASLKKAEALRATVEKIAKKDDKVRATWKKKKARSKTKAEKEQLDDKYIPILNGLDRQYERAMLAYKKYVNKYFSQGEIKNAEQKGNLTQKSFLKGLFTKAK